MKRKINILIATILFCLINYGCNKLVQIPPPQGVVTAGVVFSDSNQAASAMAGVYASMVNTGQHVGICDGSLSIFSGFSADELIPFQQNSALGYEQFFTDNILITNPQISPFFWSSAYSTIYQCNAVIDGLASSHTIQQSIKNELTAEAEFVRALCYFYLTNLFGDVPLALTTAYNKTSLLPRAPASTVYDQVISDLLFAQNNLSADYSSSDGRKILPTKWAATALLARVYLYQKDYADAYTQSSVVINSNNFSLSPTPNAIFSSNSSEAILQLQQSGNVYPYNGLPEGYLLIPANPTSYPFAYLTPTLLKAFEQHDLRRATLVDSTNYQRVTYYYPYKYQLGSSKVSLNGNITQYYMVLRLSELYLIRAEAEVTGVGPGINGAINDLNAIRNRAGLSNYSGPATPTDVLNAIMHEDQVEFFCEWGHRWLDLKRWQTAIQVLSTEKGLKINQDELQYPIPTSELKVDPNLTQNPGYSGY